MKSNIKEKIIAGLIGRGLVDEKRLMSVFDEKQDSMTGLVRKLTDSSIVSDKDLMIVLSQELDIPPIDVTRVNIRNEMMGLVPEKIIQRHAVVPLARVGEMITVIMSDPTDVFAIDDLKTITGCDIGLVLATEKDIQKALHAFYHGGDEDISTIIDEGSETAEDVEFVGQGSGPDVTEMKRESKLAPIVKMVDLMVSEAVRKRASDIHIEPQEKGLRIRYRIDGELHEVLDIPRKNQNAIIARIKILSNMDITETRAPQDGRFRVKVDGKEIDLRVSSLPTIFGNKIVLRTLDKSNLSVGLESLGFLRETVEDFKKALAKPFGIILVTGPTGSGKSTTLYSILNDLNVPGRNIVTVEDPVEYQLQGITQIAAKPEIGLDFAGGLRAILRQTPDVIMVGEIRDFETADIAIKASLTGQMVLSTLHTNDAIGAITRLTNMGIEPFLIASSLIMTCAQRLLRRICPHCRREIELSGKLKEEIRVKYPELDAAEKFYAGAGCPKCHNTGYLGRMGILETVLIDDELKAMINKKVSEEELKEYLRSIGWKNLRENAVTSFILGNTTYEEVLRAT
ncbi:MAG: GspE/PulE family protein [Candidatus Omnitrophica bacterium]|nr:GspE/PulE family protein [Candidatus Omnitrophota bacterium]